MPGLRCAAQAQAPLQTSIKKRAHKNDAAGQAHRPPRHVLQRVYAQRRLSAGVEQLDPVKADLRFGRGGFTSVQWGISHSQSHAARPRRLARRMQRRGPGRAWQMTSRMSPPSSLGRMMTCGTKARGHGRVAHRAVQGEETAGPSETGPAAAPGG